MGRFGAIVVYGLNEMTEAGHRAPFAQQKGAGMGTIVVGVNSSEGADVAVEFAAKEAELRGDRLRLVAAWEVPPAVLGSGVASREFYEEFRDEAQAIVARAAARVAELRPTVMCEERVTQGPAGSVLLEESDSAEMIVVGRKEYGGFMDLTLGSVTRQLLHHARCPVLVVPPREAR